MTTSGRDRRLKVLSDARGRCSESLGDSPLLGVDPEHLPSKATFSTTEPPTLVATYESWGRFDFEVSHESAMRCVRERFTIEKCLSRLVSDYFCRCTLSLLQREKLHTHCTDNLMKIKSVSVKK
ncbi:hypothetical protein EVAR_50673_1 [Eumeta japonica]|uniref:Uncharacterized protein n=1 Tax=Eumeta variegata TaxID=151549 RepID=A0A4C1XS26_EUMVA|nr:hypothetical protein EVAR_50673_1 [Eumeta japonica]